MLYLWKTKIRISTFSEEKADSICLSFWNWFNLNKFYKSGRPLWFQKKKNSSLASLQFIVIVNLCIIQTFYLTIWLERPNSKDQLKRFFFCLFSRVHETPDFKSLNKGTRLILTIMVKSSREWAEIMITVLIEPLVILVWVSPSKIPACGFLIRSE